jgi:hypothetical protein
MPLPQIASINRNDAMTTLLDLPTEILAQIVSELQNHWRPGPEDFKDIRQSCSRMRSMTDPFFFHSLKIDQYDCTPAIKLLVFASAVARRAELKKLVRCVDVLLEKDTDNNVDPDHDSHEVREVWSPFGFDPDSLREAAPAFFWDVEDWAPFHFYALKEMTRLQYINGRRKYGSRTNEYVKNLARKSIAVYPHVTALLSLLPNLEMLRIHDWGYDGNRQMDRLLDCMSLFQELQEFSFWASNDSDVYWNPSASDLLLLLRLPSLKTIALEHVDLATCNVSSISSLNLGSLGIENLAVRNCKMQTGHIVHLIRACRRLTSFAYKTWDNDTPNSFGHYDDGKTASNSHGGGTR